MLDVWLPHFRKPLGLDQARDPQEARNDVLWHCFKGGPYVGIQKFYRPPPSQNYTIFAIHVKTFLSENLLTTVPLLYGVLYGDASFFPIFFAGVAAENHERRNYPARASCGAGIPQRAIVSSRAVVKDPSG